MKARTNRVEGTYEGSVPRDFPGRAPTHAHGGGGRDCPSHASFALLADGTVCARGAVLLTDGTVKSWGIDQGTSPPPFCGGTSNSDTPSVTPRLRSPVVITGRLALVADGMLAYWENPRGEVVPVPGILAGGDRGLGEPATV